MIIHTDAFDDPSAAKELPQEHYCGARRGRLRYRKLMLDLPAKLAACVSDHRYRKAALAVNEADDPLLET